jgi:hypothetical protein
LKGHYKPSLGRSYENKRLNSEKKAPIMEAFRIKTENDTQNRGIVQFDPHD